jgi:hypothetical protein
MADKTVKRRLQDASDAALASDDARSSQPWPSWLKRSNVAFPKRKRRKAELDPQAAHPIAI